MATEDRFTPPTERCPNPHYWHSVDVLATEFEVAEMVGGLVRGLQPDVVVETGTHRGVTAEQIGIALHKNGHGMLHTLEVDGTITQDILNRVAGLPVALHMQESLTWVPPDEIQFAWFDSLRELRWAEFLHYREWMRPGAIVGFHDSAPHQGNWMRKVENSPLLRVINLPTPRGVMLGEVM